MKQPKFWSHPNTKRGRLLAPIGRLYEKSVERRFKKTKPYSPQIPVICVGNISVGTAATAGTEICMAGIRNPQKIVHKALAAANVNRVQHLVGNFFNRQVFCSASQNEHQKLSVAWVGQPARKNSLAQIQFCFSHAYKMGILLRFLRFF